MAAKTSVQGELDDLRSRILALEQDNEMLMDLAKNISRIFSLTNSSADDDKLIAYKKGESKAINTILKNVSKCTPITANHYATIEKLSDTSVYTDADWFRKQLISSFETCYFMINKMQPWEFKFDEVKGYLKDISQKPDKLEFTMYVRNLKCKD